MNIHKSAEDYLEMILMLREKKGYARSVDISLALGVTKPSVSFAMKKLRDIYDRHKALTAFLIRLGVDEAIAKEDACKIEHDISDETYQAVLKQIQNA